MRLYDHPRSPWCQCVRLVLQEKGLAVERHIVLPGQEEEAWFLELNPAGRIPVLEDGDLLLRDAPVIMEYLDEAYPDRALMPASPAERARVRTLVALVDNDLGPALQELEEARAEGAPDSELDELLREVAVALDLLEGDLETEASWAVGGEYTLADAALAPFLLGLVEAAGAAELLERRPAIAAYQARLRERPSSALVLNAGAEWQEMTANLMG
ncbi:MAG: glutathione S-transferase family protein [Deltaproteobacteria bacterium]|nr:MAG: glutathione S-transferase family protein [Deltaproteobacteria bacterium]